MKNNYFSIKNLFIIFMIGLLFLIIGLLLYFYQNKKLSNSILLNLSIIIISISSFLILIIIIIEIITMILKLLKIRIII